MTRVTPPEPLWGRAHKRSSLALTLLLLCLALLGYKVGARLALIRAAESGQERRIELLLALGASADSKDPDLGVTALMFAAQNGHAGVARILLSEGASIDARSYQGVTALIYAAGNGHVGLARTLIVNGADVNAKDREGMTVLSYVDERLYPEVAGLLRKAGATR